MANSIVYVPAKTGQAYWVMVNMFTFLLLRARNCRRKLLYPGSQRSSRQWAMLTHSPS